MNQNLSSYFGFFYTVANAGNISKAAKRTLHQPACHQQIHSETGRKFRMQTVFPQFPRVLYWRTRPVTLWTCSGSLWNTDTWGRQIKTLHRSWCRSPADSRQFHTCNFLYFCPIWKNSYGRIRISVFPSTVSRPTKRLICWMKNKIDIGLIGKPDNFKNINFYYLDNIEDIFVANPDYLSNLEKRDYQ